MQISNMAFTSINEAKAIVRKLKKSFLLFLPLPSAMFNAIVFLS